MVPLIVLIVQLLLCFTVKQTDAACPAGHRSTTTADANCDTGRHADTSACYCIFQHKPMFGCPSVSSCYWPPRYGVNEQQRARDIAQIYIDLECRCPEENGLGSWVSSGKTIATIRADIGKKKNMFFFCRVEFVVCSINFDC